MITLKKIGIPMAAICLMTIGVSCNDPKDSKEVAEDINKENFDRKEAKDADRLVEAYSSNLLEIELGKQATIRATTSEVKKLGEMLVDAHSKMNSDIKTLAEKKGVVLATDLTDDQKKDVEKMNEKKGMDYDKTFVDKMKSKHENAIDFYEKASNKCEDTEIKVWAAMNVAEVRTHLDMVLMTQDAIKDKK